MSSPPARVSGDWIAARETRDVMRALSDAGGMARFVGGCVRNALLGEAVTDVDIATTLRPEQVVDAVERAGLRAVPTGLEHGTVTVVARGRPFEVTTLRRDVETFGRHARVAYTDDWLEDASRRDFTMNALYAEPDGTVVDPLGGLADLEARRVRFVGDPDRRITEDYLRILRFFRFHARYGEGAPDAEGLAACTRHADGLRHISAERIGQEVLKLLSAPEPGGAVRAMARAGVLNIVLGADCGIDVLERTVRIEAALRFNPGPLRRLAALTGGCVGHLKDALRLSNRQAEHLGATSELMVRIQPQMSDTDVREAIYRNGRAVWRDAVVAAWAISGNAPADPGWRRLAGFCAWEPPAFPLSGRDLLEAGFPAGPELGRLLTALEREWLASDCESDRDTLLARAAEIGVTASALRGEGS